MATNIHDSLKQQVLTLETRATNEREQNQKLQAISKSLTSTTNIEPESVAAVLRNLTEEQKGHNRRYFPAVHLIKPVHKRIAVYLIMGFMAYSAYKAAQIQQIEQESGVTHNTQNFKVDFMQNVSMFKMLIGEAYLKHYESYGSFPTSVNDLNKHYSRTTKALNSYPFAANYKLLEDGSVSITLSDSFGYGRWLTLKPGIQRGTFSDTVGFSCTSNAQENLLHFTNTRWCNHST